MSNATTLVQRVAVCVWHVEHPGGWVLVPRALLCLLVLGSVSAMATRAGAQRVIELADPPQCAQCRVVLERVVELGARSDTALPMTFPSVQRSGDSYVVTGARSELLVYDARGKLTTTWGRAGAGPGEFTDIARIASLRGDSLLVVDWGTRRLTILDGNGRLGRTIPVPMQVLDVFATSDGRGFVVSGQVGDADRIGYPLHRMTSSGVLATSFGGNVSVLPGRLAAAQRVIARDPADGVWSASPARYVCELWGGDGNLRMAFSRRADWFPDPGNGPTSRRTWRDRPLPRVRDLHVDSAGRLWVLAVVARADWRPPATPSSRPLSSEGEEYDTIIEVIDPTRRELMASARFRWAGFAFTDSGMVVSYGERPDGTPFIALWRPVLSQ